MLHQAKQILDAKLTEMQLEVTQRKLAAEKAEEDSEKLSEELNAVKKVVYFILIDQLLYKYSDCDAL